MKRPPNFQQKIQELPFLILLVLIIFVSLIFCMNMGEDQWSEFVVWIMGLWFGEQTIKKFSKKDETPHKAG